MNNNTTVTILKDTATFYVKNILKISYIIFPIAVLEIISDKTIPYLTWSLYQDQGFLLRSVKDFMFYPIYAGALIYLFSKILTGERWTFKGALSTCLRFYLYLFFVGLISKACLFLGALVFIIPGIILAARLSLAEFLIVLENYTPIKALKKSWVLTKYHTWPIVGSMAILFFGSFFLTPLKMIESKVFPLPLRHVVSGLNEYIVTLYGSIFLVFFFRLFCLYYSKVLNNGETSDVEENPDPLYSLIIWIKNKIILKPTGFNSWNQAAIFVFLLWIVSPMTSGEPLMSILITVWILFTGGVAIIFIIMWFPANLFVNLNIVSTFNAFDDLSLSLLYIIMYWLIFIALHLLTILNRKYLAYLLLAIFLVATAYSCDGRLPDFG